LAAIAAGILLVASLPLSAVLLGYSPDFGIYLLLGIALLLLAVALPTLRRLQAGRFRRLGLAGYVLSIIGAAVLMISATVLGSVAVLGPHFPFLGWHEPPSFLVELFYYGPPSVAYAGVAGGVVLLLVGLFVFGSAMARANVLVRGGALMLALGILFGMAAAVIHVIFFNAHATSEAPWAARFPFGSPWGLWWTSGIFLGLMLTGVGLARLGYAVWAPPKEEKVRERLLRRELARRRVWRWTDFGGKKGWDWLQLLIVPLVIAVAGLWFTISRTRGSDRLRTNVHRTPHYRRTSIRWVN
jgi:hypothetical protein